MKSGQRGSWQFAIAMFAGAALLGACGGYDSQAGGESDEQIGQYEDALSTSITTDSSISSPCASGYWDMLDWLTSNTRTTQHQTSTASASDYKANYIGPVRLYQVKGSAGYPWDVLNFDTTATGNIYQWATENTWSDPSSYKVHTQNNNLGTVFTPRCVKIPKDSSGNVVWNGKLWGLSHNMAYNIYNTGCTFSKSMDATMTAINELWGPFSQKLTVNGSKVDVIENHYRQHCSTTQQTGGVWDGTWSCMTMEVFSYSQTYGWIKWEQFSSSNPSGTTGTWTHSAGGDVYDGLATPGAPTPSHPCW